MPFLLGAIPWRLVAVIGVVAGLFFGAMYITAQIKKIGRLEVQLSQATATANANAAEAKRLEAENDRIRKEAAEAAKAKDTIRKAGSQRRQAIAVTPPADDGPLAPIARRWIDGLPDGAAPGSGAGGAAPPAKGARGASNALPGAF